MLTAASPGPHTTRSTTSNAVWVRLFLACSVILIPTLGLTLILAVTTTLILILLAPLALGVWLSVLAAVSSYYQVSPAAGNFLAPTAIWITVAGTLIGGKNPDFGFEIPPKFTQNQA